MWNTVGKSFEMISTEEAKRLVLDNTRLSLNRELPLREASGLVTAEDITARHDIPGFPQSSMDGYAIRYSDREKPLLISGEMPAGTAVQLSVDEGQAVRIFTGAPLPSGADTILVQEKARVEGTCLQALDPDLQPGLYVRPRGSEVRAGELAVKKGTFLSPAAIGFLAAIGSSGVPVFAPPGVGIIITGDELVKPGQPPGYGQVYEANSFSLESALRQTPVREIGIDFVRDSRSRLKHAIANALALYDLVLINGGVSAGAYDYVVEAARESGVQQHFHRVKQKPGKPLFFGTYGGKPVFGLPGNPSSALMCFYEYVLPALEKIMHLQPSVRRVGAEITHDYGKPGGLTHFVKAWYEKGMVTPLHAQESYRMHSFARSNAFIVLPEASEGLRKGDTAQVDLLPGFSTE